jgi:two-component system, OmpR family, sensor histidine kinase MtrB
MADAVQARIEREARFASDVSHELRSPITALTAAVEVLDARRDDLPERTQQALDVVVSQVRRFDDMVIDLLELAVIDAGATDVHGETVDLPTLCERVAAGSATPTSRSRCTPRTARRRWVDKVRFERILGNLLENARNHGGGRCASRSNRRAVASSTWPSRTAGPASPQSERQRIFERFARGSAARHRIGTGLGSGAGRRAFARALGGDAWVEDRPAAVPGSSSSCPASRSQEAPR